MDQHHNGLPNSLPGAGSNAKVPSLGSLDFQTSTLSCQIPPQTLAAWRDELLGRPAGSLGMPAMDQPVLQQASMQGAKSVPVEHGIAFSQPVMKCQANMPRQFPPSNVAVRPLSTGLPNWSSGNLVTVVSASNLGGLNGTQNSNLQVQMLQQQQLHPVLSESNCAINVQPSSLVLPSQVSKNFQVRENTVLANQNSVVVPSPLSTSLQAGKSPIPMNRISIFASPRSSSSMQEDNNLSLINQSSPLTNTQGENNPGLINQNSTTGPSQPSNSFQGGNNPVLINQNSIMGPSQSLTSFQGGNNPGLINQNSMVVPLQPLTSFQEGSSSAPISYSSSYKNNSTIVDHSLLSSQSNNVQPGQAQVSDEGFKNATVLNSYSIPKPISTSVSSSADVSTSWQAQTPDGSIGPVNQPSCLVPNLSNIQGAGAENLPDQGQGRNLGLPNLSNIQGGGTVSQTLPYQGRGLGFVGKGACIPSRFAVDEFESPTSGLSLEDDGDILNLDLFGCNGDL